MTSCLLSAFVNNSKKDYNNFINQSKQDRFYAISMVFLSLTEAQMSLQRNIPSAEEWAETTVFAGYPMLTAVS